MKITGSELAMHSDHLAQARQTQTESLRAWRGQRPDFSAASPLPSVLADISAAARRLLDASPATPPVPGGFPSVTPASSAETQAIDNSNAIDNDPFLALVRNMIEMLTGEEVRVFDMQAFSAEMRHTEMRAAEVSQSVQGGNGRAGFGIEYDYHSLREEFEQTRFSAEGIVRTADGQEISFKLDLEMTRYYREETSVSLRAGDAVRKDPLVVNFGGTAAELQDRLARFFRFDLDGDGKEENLPLFASASGYLAFDRDGNGRIDSGRELFGPQSNNGFAELALLDADGNGWIDDADSAFEKLSVWTPDAEGTGDLRSLGDLGIGALAIAHVDSPFALRGSDNRDLGVINSTGLYLTENGTAGSLQEIDLTV